MVAGNNSTSAKAVDRNTLSPRLRSLSDRAMHQAAIIGAAESSTSPNRYRSKGSLVTAQSGDRSKPVPKRYSGCWCIVMIDAPPAMKRENDQEPDSSGRMRGVVAAAIVRDLKMQNRTSDPALIPVETKVDSRFPPQLTLISCFGVEASFMRIYRLVGQPVCNDLGKGRSHCDVTAR